MFSKMSVRDKLISLMYVSCLVDVGTFGGGHTVTDLQFNFRQMLYIHAADRGYFGNSGATLAAKNNKICRCISF